MDLGLDMGTTARAQILAERSLMTCGPAHYTIHPSSEESVLPITLGGYDWCVILDNVARPTKGMKIARARNDMSKYDRTNCYIYFLIFCVSFT